MAKKAKVKENGMFLELAGKVSLITKKGGKVTGREPLDGKMVLECYLHVLEDALDRMDHDPEFVESMKKCSQEKNKKRDVKRV